MGVNYLKIIMYKFVIVTDSGNLEKQCSQVVETMLFKENRYKTGGLCDAMTMASLPPVHSTRLLIVAIPTESCGDASQFLDS